MGSVTVSKHTEMISEHCAAASVLDQHLFTQQPTCKNFIASAPCPQSSVILSEHAAAIW